MSARERVATRSVGVTEREILIVNTKQNTKRDHGADSNVAVHFLSLLILW